MDTNKMRDAFEAWAIEDAASTGRSLKFERGGEWYLGKDHQQMNLGWASWQASREAVVVELPSEIEAPPYACFQSGWNDMRGEAVDAIEAQGLRVKP